MTQANGMPPATAAQDRQALDDNIGRRTVSAMLNMTAREAAIKVVAFAGWIVLSRVLEPAQFGLFALASFSVNLFNIFSELGLGAAFVREREEVPPRALDALFTYQLVWVLAISLPAFVSAPLLANLYGLPDLEIVVQALAVSLVLISLRTVPSVLLQRRLRYGPIALSDVAAQAAFWLVAIVLALGGLGVWAIACSVVAFGVTGTSVLFVGSGWRPRLLFRWSAMRGKVASSLMYHGQTLASLAKYSMLIVVGGAALGPGAVGYLTWAHQVAVTPALLTLLVTRVSFPALAQVQHRPEKFGDLLLAIVLWTCRLTFPACAVLIALAPQVTEYIYGAKWLQALSPFYLFTLHTALWAPAAILITALYSYGRAAQGLRILALMTLLAWLGATTFSWLGLGATGLALAYLLSTAVALGYAIYQTIGFEVLSWMRAAALPLASGLLLGGGLYLVAPYAVHGVVSLVALALVAGLAMLAVNLVGEYTTAITYAKSLLLGFPSIRADRVDRATAFRAIDGGESR